MMNLPSTITDTTRRQWVKQFLLGTASVLCGSGGSSRLVAEVLTTGPGPGVIRLDVAKLPALAEPGGSVQMTFISYIEPFTLNRVSADRFVTLDSICTHAGCTVSRFIVENNRMTCPCHGSRYDIEGRVIRGPAEAPLGRYATVFDVPTGIISITLPDLALHIESIAIHNTGPGDAKRLKLVFPASLGATYEIYYQADLTSPLVLTPFSLSPAGLANRHSFTSSIGETVTAYVDASGARGFFSVGVKLS